MSPGFFMRKPGSQKIKAASKGDCLEDAKFIRAAESKFFAASSFLVSWLAYKTINFLISC